MLSALALIAIWILLTPFVLAFFFTVSVMTHASVKNWLITKRRIRNGYRNPISRRKQILAAVGPAIAGLLAILLLHRLIGGWSEHAVIMSFAALAAGLLVVSRVLHKWVWE